MTFRDEDGLRQPAPHGGQFPLAAAISMADLDHDPHAGRPVVALPRLRLEPGHPAAPRGLVFRMPPELRVLWAA